VNYKTLAILTKDSGQSAGISPPTALFQLYLRCYLYIQHRLSPQSRRGSFLRHALMAFALSTVEPISSFIQRADCVVNNCPNSGGAVPDRFSRCYSIIASSHNVVSPPLVPRDVSRRWLCHSIAPLTIQRAGGGIPAGSLLSQFNQISSLVGDHNVDIISQNFVIVFVVWRKCHFMFFRCLQLAAYTVT